MCLGVPGKVLRVDENPVGMTMGQVSFGGIVKEVCLAYTPEAAVGDYVLVHVGFAISKIDEAQALDVFRALEEMDALGDLEVPQVPQDPQPTDPSPSGTAAASNSAIYFSSVRRPIASFFANRPYVRLWPGIFSNRPVSAITSPSAGIMSMSSRAWCLPDSSYSTISCSAAAFSGKCNPISAWNRPACFRRILSVY